MPRTFTFTPTEQDQTFPITVIKDELTVVNVAGGNEKLQLSISTTRGGSPIIQIPSTGGKFDLRPSLLETLDEGMTYQHNIWDYSASTDGKRIATGTFTHAESIRSVDIAYPTVTLPDGTLRIFVTQAQYNVIDPKDPNAEYVIDGATVPPDPALTAPANTALPAISGAQEVGSVLTVNNGAWTGNPAPTFTRQWKRNGIPITGQVATTYTTVTADVGQVITCTVVASNSQGNGVATTVGLTVMTAAEISVRQGIVGLRDQTTPNGRQTTVSKKIVGIDPLPDGVTRSGVIITMTADEAALEDWELGPWRVDMAGANQRVVNNDYNCPASIDTSAWYCINILATARNPVVEYNTIDGYDGYGGPGCFINMPTIGEGEDAEGAIGGRIRYNRFLHPNSDVIKSSGNGTLIEYNYYGPLTNYPEGTNDWSNATSYGVGDYVVVEGTYLFVSRVAGNINNAPPQSKVNVVSGGTQATSRNYSSGATYGAGELVNDDNYAVYRSLTSGNVNNALTNATHWVQETGATVVFVSLDPHGDANTVTASNGAGVTIRRNLIDWSSEYIKRAVGTTQIVRVVRNTGSPVLMGPVTISENVSPGPFKGFHPLAFGYIRDWISSTTYILGGFASDGGVWYESLVAGNRGNRPSLSPTQWKVTDNINAPGPIVVRDNLIGAGPTGSYINGSDDAVDVWLNNRDAETDTVIPSPILRQQGRQVVAAVGQSETAISLFLAASFYNQQPKPALLPGVDGIMIVSGHNSDDGLPQRVDITQANIDAGRVNAGAVAYFNMMHHLSGGRPQALVDIADPGTGMTGMMDDQHTGRDYTIDAATVQLARDHGVDPDLAIYIWSNAEASASPDLITNRNPHLIGRNPDGTAYDFAVGPLDHCLIDTTERGFGLLSDTAKLSLMLFHPRIITPTDLINPPLFGYRTNADGSQIAGMVKSNGIPALQARKDFLAQPYLDGNRGKVGVSQAVSLYGDYASGVKLDSGQTSIHPSVKEADGQILSAQHIAAHAAYAYGYLTIPSGMAISVSSDGLTVTGQVSLPAGTTLKTIRQIKGQTVSSPRPHQQDVMGFALWRGDGSFSETETRPVWRVGQGPSAAYEGAAVVADPAQGRVTLTLQQPLADGDHVDFGTDGQYGTFMLYGFPDFDARMYQDALVAHDPDLYAATGYYGVPVEPQARYVVGSVTLPPDPDPEPNSGTWSVSGGNNALTVNSFPAVTAPTATGGNNSIAITG